jgi:hypothetical protein
MSRPDDATDEEFNKAVMTAPEFLAAPPEPTVPSKSYVSIRLSDLDDPVVAEFWRDRETARALQQQEQARREVLFTPVEILRARHQVSRIIAQYGTWAVTTYGVECLVDDYPIEKSRLFETDWIRHVTEKVWVVAEDFIGALQAGRLRYPQRRSSPSKTSVPTASS